MVIIKFNILFIFIILIITIINNSSGETISKEKILSLKATKCTENKDCPESVEFYNGICHARYYCHNEECIEIKEGMSFRSDANLENYKFYNTTDLILESCPEDARNIEKCFTRYCLNDSNCYSNKCFNNTCIINNQFTTTSCSVYTGSDHFTCSRLEFENCKNDKECYPYRCNEYHFCTSAMEKNWLGIALFKVYFIIILIIIIIVFIIFKLIIIINKKCTIK